MDCCYNCNQIGIITKIRYQRHKGGYIKWTDYKCLNSLCKFKYFSLVDCKYKYARPTWGVPKKESLIYAN